MSDQYVQVQPNSTGLKIDTSELTVGSNTVERQRMVVADPTTAANLAGVTSGGALKVDASATTQPVSGTVSVTGTFWQATQPVSLTGTQATNDANAISLGSTTSGEKGFLEMGAVTTSAPSYTTGQSQALSLNTAGGLRVDPSGVTSPVSLASCPTHAVTQSGTWTAVLTPNTSGGLTTYKLISAASTNAAVVKSSAGQLYNIQAYNSGGSVAYLKIYNTSSAPTVGTTVPTETHMIPAGGGVVIERANGVANATGISISINGGMADTDTTAVTAAQVAVNLQFK